MNAALGWLCLILALVAIAMHRRMRRVHNFVTGKHFHQLNAHFAVEEDVDYRKENEHRTVCLLIMIGKYTFIYCGRLQFVFSYFVGSGTAFDFDLSIRDCFKTKEKKNQQIVTWELILCESRAERVKGRRKPLTTSHLFSLQLAPLIFLISS